MNSWWLLWPITGLLSGLWLYFVLFSNDEPVEKITLGELLSGAGMLILATMFGPISITMAIAFTWDEFNLSDVVLWRRKPLDLQKEAKKRGYTLKPLKGMDDA